MNDFTSVYPESKVLDPRKRVNYIHGLVLGVDEFNQEECYLLEKDRLHNRALHGYGTVCGLRVSQQDEEETGLQIKVDAGMAISPSGQVIQVPRTQCAVLAEWLASHVEEVTEALGSPATGGALSLYLMLCYRECKTDLVPIPTGPCQSLEESSAASRIADDFSLSFELQAPPDEHLESAMQGLSELLLSIPVEVGGALTLDEIKDLVRTLIPEGSPPDVIPDSPPLSSPSLTNAIAPENVYEFFNAALLVWVTEVKPCLLTDSIKYLPSDSFKDCVFLAQINLDVETVGGIIRLVPESVVEIDEQLRQFLVNSQGIQHYLTPLYSWLKNLSNNVAVPELLPLSADADEFTTLSSDQVITGSKTFGAPLLLSSQGLVFKNIILPGYQAHSGRGAARGLFRSTLPSLHFMTTGRNAFGGEALMNIPIPEDIVYARGFQFRLIWGFEGEPDPSDIQFNWAVGAQFFQENENISTSPFQFVRVAIDESTERRNDILVTGFENFDRTVILNRDSRLGAIHIRLEDPGVVISQVYLLQVELQYVADRLGRSV